MASLRRQRTPAHGSAVVRTLCAVSAAVLCDLGAASAQSGAVPQPRFDVRTELVLVDVTAVDRTGQPIGDLSEADFDLEVNGQARTLQSVQYVSTVPDPAAVEAARSVDYSTNEAPTSGRLLLFVVDEGHMRVGSARTVARTARLLIDRLAPGDLVGVARLPNGVGGVEFTTDRARVVAALERVAGTVGSRPGGPHVRLSEAAALESGDSVQWQQAIDRECQGERGLGLEACIDVLQSEARSTITDAAARAQATIRALDGLLERLASLDMPVTIVMISEGLFVARGRQGMEDVAQRAAEARATLHIVRPGQSFFDIEDRAAPGLGAFLDDGLWSEGLERLAAETRGTFSQINAGSGATVFERLGRELGGYYLLGFEPTDADRTGRERKIRVRVRRRDVTVRARPTFVIRTTAERRTEQTQAIEPKPPAGTMARLEQLLGAPLPARGLPIRVASFTATNAQDSRMRVIISAEIGEPASEAAEWPVGLLVLDENDKIVASSIASTLLEPARAGAASRRLLLTSVLVDPGEYTLRLAAIDGDGHEGSVHHSIAARFTSGPGRLQIADLVLVPPMVRGEAPRPVPAAVIDTEMANALLEMSSSDRQALARARVRVQVVAAGTETPLVTVDARPSSRGDGRRAFAAPLRLAVLPPGDYVARAIVSIAGEEDGTVARRFHLEAVAPSASRAPSPAGLDPDPDAPPLPPPTSRILAHVPKFVPSLVVRPEVVAPFLEGLLDLHPPSPALASIVEDARRGRYAAPDVDGSRPADDELTLSFIRGLAALQKNELPQAAAWFQQTARGAEDFLGAAFYLGACHAASGRDAEAIGAWQMALLSENPGAVYPLLVDALLRIGDSRQAADVLAEAPAAWADDRERLRREATAEAMLGDFTAALPKLAELLADSPDPDPSLVFMAIQVLYRLHADNGGLDESNRARFERYVAQYEQMKGPDLALVQTWKRAVLK